MSKTLPASANRKASTELLFPLPGTGNDKTVRAFLFADAGNVFDNRYDFGDLRYSAGICISWFAPIGADIKLSLGYPLKRKPGDDTQRVWLIFCIFSRGGFSLF